MVFRPYLGRPAASRSTPRVTRRAPRATSDGQQAQHHHQGHRPIGVQGQFQHACLDLLGQLPILHPQIKDAVLPILADGIVVTDAAGCGMAGI